MTEQITEVVEKMDGLSVEGGVKIECVPENPVPELCDKATVDKWHKFCDNCKFPLTDHLEYGDSHVETIREKLQILKPELLLDQYCWTPPELNEEEIQLYMALLNADDRPTVDRSADVKRQLLTQLPVGDLVKSANFSSNDKDTIRLYDQFVKQRDLECLGLGDVGPAEADDMACTGCEKPVEKGNLVIFSDVTDEVWHPDCFRCFDCKQLLSELVHCYDGDLLCVRHYGESIKKRCHGCDQLIFASEYTKSKGYYYHMEHYNCSQCKEPLTGKRYVLRQEQPTCLPCYEEKFANRCEKCEKPIGTDFKDLSYKGRHWHEACFLCWGCQNSLANQQFVAKDNGLYCPDCYDKSFAQRCDACTNTFKHGMQKFEYSGKKYHHDCFCCGECKQPIGNNSFVPKDDDRLICMPCYNNNFAQKCAKCSEVLLQGGVTFREAAYHRECFLCTSCKTELANVKFATKDDQPYCPDCYIKTFAKICEKCDKPIAGLGQATKYVAFEGRQWHAECFMCAKCTKSLLGQGFLVCNTEVVCPDCGKNL